MSRFLSPQFKEAVKRWAIAALIAAIPATADFLTTGNAFGEFGAGGTIIALSLARVLEGVYDSYRNEVGKVIPADVTAGPANPAPADHQQYLM